MAQESTAGLPFTSIGFQGTAEINGEGVIFGHTQGYKNMGATVDPDDSNNDGLIPYYGLVVSSSSGSAEDLVALGQPSGYVVRGILQFDAAVAQNDPAKATYVLPGLPTSMIYAGTAKYQSWTTTQSGADDPALGCVPIFRATSAGTGDAPIGAIEFLPSGTVAAPTGWALLPAYVVQVTEFGDAILEFDFQNNPVAVPDITPPQQAFTATAILTSAAAATPVHVVAAADVPAGKKIYVTGFTFRVDGTTAWTDSTGTKVLLQDTAGSPVELAEAAKAQLTSQAVLGPYTTGITTKDPFSLGSGLTAAKGLDVVADHNFAAGSDLYVTVTGFIQ